jgi:D-glycero-D-manno-heptose 1,7-bisphosphate phosphatase
MYQVHKVSNNFGLCAKWSIKNSDFEINTQSILLDRDGVIIVDKGYTNTMKKVQLISEIIALMKLGNQKQIPISIVTNQAGVAHGFFSEKEVVEFNLDLLDFLDKAHGITVNSLVYCPSHPSAEISRYKKNCNCRKPKTGLLTSVLKENGSTAESAIFIGDQESDRLAAEELNMKFLNYPECFQSKKYKNNETLRRMLGETIELQ